MKKYLPIALLLFALGCSKTPQGKIESNYQQGLSYLQEYDFNAARASFDDIANVDSSSIWYAYGLALADEREMKVYDALNRFFFLRQEHPDFYPAHQGIIRSYRKLGFPDEELAACLDANKVSNDKFKSGIDIVEAYVSNGLIDQAKLQLKGITDASGNSAVTDFIKARLYFLSRHEDSAQTYLTKALESPLETFDYFYHGANCFEAMGLSDSSISYSRQAWQLTTGDTHDQMMLHFFRAVRTQNLFDAKAIIRDLKNTSESKMMNAGLRRFYYLGTGQMGLARQASSDLRMHEPKNFTAIIASVMSFIHASDFLGFKAEFLGIVQLAEAGDINEEMMNFIEYSTTLEYRLSSDNGEAAVKLENLDAVYTSRPEVVLSLVQLYYRGGQFDKYKKALARVKVEHKDDADWIAGLAEVLTEKSVVKYDQALELYEDALMIDPMHKTAFDGLLELCEYRKRYERYEKAFEDHNWFNQTFPGERVKRAINLVRMGKVADGFKLFNESIPMLRGDINAFATIIGLLKKSNPEKADQVAELMVKLNSQNHDALLVSAKHESDRGRFEKSLAQASEILEGDNQHYPAMVEKARADYYIGNRDVAFKAFEKILEENMTEPNGNYYFSKILAEEQIEPRRSGNLARRAFFHSDRSLKYALNLCFVYYQAERFDLCRGEAKKAIRRHSKAPELAYWLGMAQYMESKPEAKATLNKAIELGIDGEFLKNTKEVLAKL